MADQIKVDVVSTYDSKGGDEALKQAKEIDKLKPEFEVDADVSRVLNAFDQVEAEAKAVAETAEVLGRALGPDLEARADTTAIVNDLRQMGLTLDQIKGNADELGGKLKELSDADVGGKLGSNLGTARGQLDEMGKSASSSKNALANMVGNSAQDLGALGGVAGGAGVALGQLAEFAADAAFEGEKLGSVLVNMAKVAGPIAALALAIQTISAIQSRFADSSKRGAENQERMTQALLDGGDAAENYSDALADAGEITLDNVRHQNKLEGVLAEMQQHWYTQAGGVAQLGKALGITGDETKDLTRTFQHAGITADQYTAAVTGNADVQERFRDAVEKSNISAEEKSDILTKLKDDTDDYTSATESAATFEAVFGENVEKTRTALEASRQAGNDYLHFLQDRHAAAEEEINDYERNKTAADQHYSALARINTEAERVDRARILHHEWDEADRLQRKYQDLHDEISDQESLLSLKRGFEGVEGAAIVAYDAAVKGAGDAEQKSDDAKLAVLRQKDAVLEYIESLGNIPDSTTTAILALIDQQNYDAANAAIANLTKPRVVDITFNPGGRFAPRAAGGVGGGRTLLGEEGPEFVDLPPGSRVIPAPITSAMMHANGGGDTANITINMPKGSRGVDVLRQLSGQARRSGRRYGVSVVHYARTPS